MDYGHEKERRGFARFNIGIPTVYDESDLGVGVLSRTHDISVEGVCLLTNRALPPGIGLSISLKMLDTGEIISVRGRSIWSSCLESGIYRVGVKLEETKLKPIPIVLRTIKVQRNY